MKRETPAVYETILPFQLCLEIAGLEISRHGGQLDRQPIQLLGHFDLATQSTCLGQPKSQIQHIVLVVVGLGHPVVVLLVRHNNVARRACARAAASTLHLQVVGLRDIEQVVPFVDCDLVLDALLVDKCHPKLFSRLRGVNMTVAGWACCRESAKLRSECRRSSGGNVDRRLPA